MIVTGVDPGTRESALVTYTGTQITSVSIEPNEKIVEWMRETAYQPERPILVVEEFESYGMAVGKEVFRTIRWAGNFEALWFPVPVVFVPRRTVKLHICHTSRATDSNIRTALIDRFGGPDVAVGTKKAQGPLYAIKSHAWAALALAITYHDQHAQEIRPNVVPQF